MSSVKLAGATHFECCSRLCGNKKRIAMNMYHNMFIVFVFVFALAALTGDKMYSLHASNVGKSGALTFFCDQQVVTEEHYSH